MLKKFLSVSNAEFVMHYARQDLLWLKYHLKVEPKNIFCTKLASKIARTASQNHGYKDLVREIAGKEIKLFFDKNIFGNNENDPRVYGRSIVRTENEHFKYLYHEGVIAEQSGKYPVKNGVLEFNVLGAKLLGFGDLN